jgi:SAM-dependent methyltransferase
MLLEDQAQLNREFWLRGDCLDFYATRELRAVEKVLLERYRGALAGRVLELGCGAGRLSGHLLELARELHGVDVSRAMVAHSRRTLAGGVFSVCDLRDVAGLRGGPYDVVVATYNVLDVLGDADRCALLEQLRGLLVDGGLLIMSSHNRAHAPVLGTHLRVLLGSPRRPLQSVRRLPLRLRNRRRLRPLQIATSRYAIRNDEAHDFSLLHYHISRDAQERQLHELGYELLDCLDLDGRTVPRGGQARRCPELHYLARC